MDPMLLEFGLGGAVLAMVLLLFIRHQKTRLRHSVLRYERIKKVMEE
jgi:hypothetical protein